MEKQRNKKGSLPIGVRIIGIIIAVLAAAYGLYAGMGNSTGNFDGEMQIFALEVRAIHSSLFRRTAKRC